MRNERLREMAQRMIETSESLSLSWRDIAFEFRRLAEEIDKECDAKADYAEGIVSAKRK